MCCSTRRSSPLFVALVAISILGLVAPASAQEPTDAADQAEPSALVDDVEPAEDDAFESQSTEDDPTEDDPTVNDPADDDASEPEPTEDDPTVNDPAEDDGSEPEPTEDEPADDGVARGQAAIDRLGEALGDVAEAGGLDAERLSDLLLFDPGLAVDTAGRLLYLDPLPATDGDSARGEGEADSSPTANATFPVPIIVPDDGDPTDEPVDDGNAEEIELTLASLPGAPVTILLDVDGHVTTGSGWNAAPGREAIETGPFDLDGDPASWSPEELEVIATTWAVVAEDFAPWNVNVTTEEPEDPADLTADGADDDRWGIRVVLTPDDWSDCGCGILAYLGSARSQADEPAFVHHTDRREVAEGASHAIGHVLGLHHDGGPDGVARYRGHEGIGGPDWAPIMGASAGRAIGQWSIQEYVGADNIEQHDLEVISGAGFELRPDDHGGPDDPTPLNGPDPELGGFIGTDTDTDAFSFTTTGGAVLVSVAVDPVSPNLDAALTLLDDTGAVVAIDDPVDRLSATLDVELDPGGYTVEVDGVGVGLPFLDPPTGYSDVASLGRYTLTGSIEGAPAADLEPPDGPEGLLGLVVGETVLLGWAPSTDDDVDGFVLRRATEPGGPYIDVAVLEADRNGHEDLAPPAGPNHYVVVAVDRFGNRSTPSNEIAVVLEGPPIDDPIIEDPPVDDPIIEVPIVEPEPDPSDPGDENDGDEGESDENEEEVVEEPQFDVFVYGAVTGDVDAVLGDDGIGQRIVETLSGGAERARHDRLDHRWSLPAAEGNQQLRVVAEAGPDAGDADEGFIVGWSVDKIEWTPLVTILPGETIDETFDIGAPEDTVHVRVRDTDRTPRQQEPDWVLIDLLQVIGDGQPVEPPPDPTEALAEVGFHFQGLGEGERAVVVTGSVTDDLGDPIVGATLQVQIDGDVTETVTIKTGGRGTGLEQSAGAALRPEVEICVVSVEADGLDWQPGPDDCPATDGAGEPTLDDRPADEDTAEEITGDEDTPGEDDEVTAAEGNDVTVEAPAAGIE